ncbi:MAG: hypothetical protein KDI24_11825 [Pseudomonadales bacterium]|nr:hypothetical protein [Pseudomonadales bacterium]MCP5171544.1 hypothetical protein [Pseudomonadales bacterium]
MRIITAALFWLFTFVFMPATSIAQSEFDETTWYQVEVIVFSQQDLFNAEQPRRDIKLSFPDNSLYLYDPNQPVAGTTKSGDVSSAESNKPVDISGLLAHAVLDATASPDRLPDNPTEAPFVILSKDLQQLGPDHYTLNRAAGYRVLYHQAWRQPGTDFEAAPWVIVRGGEQYDDHFELEGAIRLVKSRHIHVQADIWKVDFEPRNLSHSTTSPLQSLMSQAEAISTQPLWPALPKLPEQHSSTSNEEETSHEAEDSLQASSAVRSISEGNASQEHTAQTVSPRENLSLYQVGRIVQLKQSLKLSLGKMGYLDHPNLGLLVVVKKYQPGADAIFNSAVGTAN